VRRVFSGVSLRGKLVALCLGVILAVSAVLLVELPRAMDGQSRSWIVSRSLGLARLLGSTLEAAVDSDDPAAAQETMRSLARSHGAFYAVLQRGAIADGAVLAEWGAPGKPRMLPGTGEAVDVQEHLLHVRVPLRTHSGRTATLRMGFTLEELDERRAEARASVLRATGLALVAGLLAASLFAVIVLRPLRRMTQAALRIAEDDEAAARDLPVDRGDEIGGLAQAFARMLDRLYAQREHIRAINADLAQRVQERTRELARTNGALAELARTQEQLVLADRRVSVGRLAAGVAHEVNNPLTFVRGNLDFVAQELPRAQQALDAGDVDAAHRTLQEVAGAISDVQEGAERVTHIVRGLKTFARDDDDTRDPLDLVAPMEAAIEMALHEIKHRARLIRAFGPSPRVVANEVRLSQVFLNLLLNAGQAIPEGHAPQNEIRCTIGTDGEGRAFAEVADTGTGIASDVQARIFDPFFTTKPVGVGSGLGLSISRNIVEQLGGTIDLRSAPGDGTTFRVTLPAAPSGARRTATRVASEEVPVRLEGVRVLVVDDEPLVGTVVRRALPEGEVTAVTSASEALARVRRGEQFDRILCDVMMPEMSGPELFNALPPSMRPLVIFMTGGAFTHGGASFVEGWRGPLLPKPFETTALRRLLHDANA
jgi:signal transduction histidine kinase